MKNGYILFNLHLYSDTETLVMYYWHWDFGNGGKPSEYDCWIYKLLVCDYMLQMQSTYKAAMLCQMRQWRAPWKSCETSALKEKTMTISMLTVGHVDSSQLASSCPRTMIQMGGEQQQLDVELWGCLFSIRTFWMRGSLCLTRLQCLISSSHLQVLACHHLHCWTLRADDPDDLPTVPRKCLLLKLPFLCHFWYYL